MADVVFTGEQIIQMFLNITTGFDDPFDEWEAASSSRMFAQGDLLPVLDTEVVNAEVAGNLLRFPMDDSPNVQQLDRSIGHSQAEVARLMLLCPPDCLPTVQQSDRRDSHSQGFPGMAQPSNPSGRHGNRVRCPQTVFQVDKADPDGLLRCLIRADRIRSYNWNAVWKLFCEEHQHTVNPRFCSARFITMFLELLGRHGLSTLGICFFAVSERFFLCASCSCSTFRKSVFAATVCGGE